MTVLIKRPDQDGNPITLLRIFLDEAGEVDFEVPATTDPEWARPTMKYLREATLTHPLDPSKVATIDDPKAFMELLPWRYRGTYLWAEEA